ncbi:MAG: T9SS type A sorting domain-containing protein [Flavobacteriaceae bacterium]|nr:T9SS type A sorting domain-containing protein [Flavobacteriaceae bacterium]
MKKNYFILLLLITFLSNAQLTPPAELEDYYTNVNFSLTGTNLFDDLAVETIAKHSTFLSYTDRHDYLYDADEDPSNPSNVVLIYSGESRNENEWLSGNNPYPTQTFNTEHVYPQSLISNTAQGDLHHLRVCDITINNNRGNDPFVSGSGNYGSTGSGWYPGDEWKGDVARMMLYMYMRYNEPLTDVGSLSLFLQWNAADNASDIEINRNNVIESAQGNRNPFIDNPYLATVIWGGNTAENRWATASITDSELNKIQIYPNPVTSNTVSIFVNTELKIEVYDIIGKLLFNTKVSPNNKDIDISNLNNGVYIFKLSNGSQTITKKLIKQ